VQGTFGFVELVVGLLKKDQGEEIQGSVAADCGVLPVGVSEQAGLQHRVTAPRALRRMLQWLMPQTLTI